MIRILCTSYLEPTAKSGVATYYKNVAKYFSNDTEIKIVVVTVADAPLIWKKLAGLTRKVIHMLSFGNKKGIKYAFELKNKMQIFFALQQHTKSRFDLIHAQDILSGIVAKRRFHNKVPFILTCHFNDNPVEEDMIKYDFPEHMRVHLERLYSLKFSLSSGFIFVSDYAYHKAKKLLKGSEVVKIIRNGAFFNKSKSGNARHEKDSGKRFSIVNVGYIDERKNQKIFLPLAREFINKGFKDFIITLVGDGPDLDNIKRLVAEENLEQYFNFTGWIGETQKYLNEADLLIHTAINDNCPYAVIEAISNQVPALGFNVGGMAEILDHQWLFQKDDYKALASFTLKYSHRLPEIALSQYDRIKNTFSIQQQFASLRSVYEDMAVATTGNARFKSFERKHGQ
jgi:glycosyltransferase involved in cell wall biosynthesis